MYQIVFGVCIMILFVCIKLCFAGLVPLYIGMIV
jgi:hypothetical protein